MSTTNTTKHIGRKISRIRELRGIKQEVLPIELVVNQQTVSNIKKSAAIEADLLAQVSEIIGVTPEAINNFSVESVFNFFNSFHDSSCNNGAIYATGYTINPLDKLMEAQEENKKL